MNICGGRTGGGRERERERREREKALLGKAYTGFVQLPQLLLLLLLFLVFRAEKGCKKMLKKNRQISNMAVLANN